MALVTGGLHYPVPDGIGRGLELPCQLLGRLPAAHQLYEPVPELGRVCTTCLGHGDLLPSSEDRCPPNRVTPRGTVGRAWRPAIEPRARTRGCAARRKRRPWTSWSFN